MGEIECTKCIYNINSECKIGGWTIPKVGCPDGKTKPMTNADRIRSMTDEELANKMYDWFSDDCLSCPVLKDDCSAWNIGNIRCYDALLEWLKQEAADKDGENGT